VSKRNQKSSGREIHTRIPKRNERKKCVKWPDPSQESELKRTKREFKKCAAQNGARKSGDNRKNGEALGGRYNYHNQTTDYREITTTKRYPSVKGLPCFRQKVVKECKIGREKCRQRKEMERSRWYTSLQTHNGKCRFRGKKRKEQRRGQKKAVDGVGIVTRK